MSKTKNGCSLSGVPRVMYRSALDLLMFGHVDAALSVSAQLEKPLSVEKAVQHFIEHNRLGEKEYTVERGYRAYYRMLEEVREVRA